MRAMTAKEIDSLIDTLYASVSGPPGLKRDWDQMRTLFVPGAQITRFDVPEGGCTESVMLGIKEFIASIEGFLDQNGFYGNEIVRRTEVSGNLAKVHSVYEGRFSPYDHEPFRRGTNWIRLYHDGDRWRITNMLLREFREDDLFS